MRPTVATILLYFDGSCEPTNPGGLATWGFILRDVPGYEHPVYACGAIDPKPSNTNNTAEYVAVGKALAWLAENAKAALAPSDHLLITGDSQLVLKQLAGEWRCAADNLIPLKSRCLELLRELKCKWSTHHVKRDLNAAADALSQAAYVGRTNQPYPHRHPAPEKKP